MIMRRAGMKEIFAEGDTIVYCASLKASNADIIEYASLLSPDETQRAAAIGNPISRRRFIVRRALLRAVLGKMLGQAPTSIRFETGKNGKPKLRGVDLNYSVSSSGDTAVFAISRANAVGVDIEKVDPEFEFESVVEKYFSESERKSIQSIEEPQAKNRVFYDKWTEKEAALKAHGLTFDDPLPADVSMEVQPIDGLESYAICLATVSPER